VQYKDSAYALSIGKNVTTYFEKYYGVPFPLSKQGTVYLLIRKLNHAGQ
jgi:aminopeptidase N